MQTSAAQRTSQFNGAFENLPSWAFVPDHWNITFLKGLVLHCKTWENKTVWEVGVGTGYNLVALHQHMQKVSHCFFSDFDERAVPLAKRNLLLNGIGTERHTGLPGSWNLITPPPGMHAPSVDVLFACIPQVPCNKMVSRSEDTIAHYYDAGACANTSFNWCGLGLNELLLLAAREHLKAGSEVILNLSGRPGRGCLEKLFTANGYKCDILHEEVVPQHRETSLFPLTQVEKVNGVEFEFFADSGGTKPITALRAEARRRHNNPVFHKVYVIKGTLG